MSGSDGGERYRKGDTMYPYLGNNTGCQQQRSQQVGNGRLANPSEAQGSPVNSSWQADNDASIRCMSQRPVAANMLFCPTCSSSRLGRTFTSANSAATKKPFISTRIMAKIILTTSVIQIDTVVPSKFKSDHEFACQLITCAQVETSFPIANCSPRSF